MYRRELHYIKLLMEKRIEHGLEMHMYFIDLEKAYDRVNRAKLFSILPDYEIPTKIIWLIEEMYDGTRIKIKLKLGDNILDPAEIDNMSIIMRIIQHLYG